MFKTNETKDRVSYGNLLLPPDGYTLNFAVGTTYSLDLEALTAVCISLGLSEDTDSTLLQNPVSMLNTGDFRSHGFRGKGLLPTLRKYAGKVDVLICEGTTLSRPDYSHVSEQELRSRIKTALEENKYVFVLCSSTNFDRIASVCSVIPRGKYCICDDYQYEMIQYLRQTGGTKSSLYACDGILRYGRNLDARMTDKGFCMFVRSGNPFHRQMMERFPDAVVIYSMWKGYLERPDMQAFLRGFHRIDLHTSGHADGETIRMVIDAVDPGCIIPMHTEKPDAFISLADGRKILFPQDGDCITL